MELFHSSFQDSENGEQKLVASVTQHPCTVRGFITDVFYYKESKYSDSNHVITRDRDLQKEPFSCSKSSEPAIALLPCYALGTPQWL